MTTRTHLLDAESPAEEAPQHGDQGISSSAEAVTPYSEEPLADDPMGELLLEMENRKLAAEIMGQINLGVGVAMVEAGVSKITITSGALAEFNAKYEVVMQPTDAGGYTVELIAKDTAEYGAYLAAQASMVNIGVAK